VNQGDQASSFYIIKSVHNKNRHVKLFVGRSANNKGWQGTSENGERGFIW